MNYAALKTCDIANGPGVRTSLFVSGCRRRCPNCFNAVAQDFTYGRPFDKAARNQVLESLAPAYVSGLTLLGGEPLEPENQRALLPFLHHVRALYPHKTIWCYTGYLFEKDILNHMVPKWKITGRILELLDVLVDGPFIEEQKYITLLFRGSSNQRLIDVPKSLASGETILWKPQE